MYSLDDLIKQNQEISQLCDVLSVLMEDSSLHNNPYVEELLTRFKEKVWMHLVFEDNSIYAGLLNAKNQDVRATAKAFHDSAKEIKHHFSDFVKHWRSITTTKEHESLSIDCRKIFRLIRERINYENNEIFPLIQ